MPTVAGTSIVPEARVVGENRSAKWLFGGPDGI